MAGQYGTQRIEVLGEVGQESRKVEGSLMPPAMSRMGAQITIDQVLQWAIDGRTFHAQSGDAVTRVAWVVTTYDENQPTFSLTVPAGVTVIPLSLDITVEIQAGTFSHLVWSTTTNDIGVGTSTSLTISSMRRDAPHSALGVTANAIYSGDSTTATGLIEVIRYVDPFVFAAAGAPRNFNWDIKNSSVVPVLVGPASLQLNHAATGSDAEGYIKAIFTAFPSPDLVRLAS